MKWLENHEPLIRAGYRLLTLVLLTACLWRIELAIDEASSASWEASSASSNAEEAVQVARDAERAAEEAANCSRG